MKKRYLIHYFDPSVESTLSEILEFDDKEILDYCASLKTKGCVEIHYTHYDQESGAPKNPYIDYPPVKRCPVCGRVPSISYACGEYFVDGREGCSFCGVGGTFSEMHASRDGEVDAWNQAVNDESQCQCPLGGDEHDDCDGCAYSTDYHFVNGECVRRDDG